MDTQKIVLIPRKRWTKSEKIAYHEAGHAVMLYILKMPLKEVSLIPDREAGSLAHVLHDLSISSESITPDVEMTLEGLEAIEKDILVSLAGDVAWKALTGRSNNMGASDDYRTAADRALYFGSPHIANIALRYLRLKAELMLHATWHLVQPVANLLLEKNLLTGEEAEMCVKKAEQDWLGTNVV